MKTWFIDCGGYSGEFKAKTLATAFRRFLKAKRPKSLGVLFQGNVVGEEESYGSTVRMLQSIGRLVEPKARRRK